MTVPSTARRAGPFLGNGSTTTFSFSFKTFAAGDLLVTRTSSVGIETVLVKDSDYSVTLNGDQDTSPGGSITYPISGSALASGEKLTIVGDLDYEQTTDLLGGGAFNARVIEDTFDRTVIQIQQLEERLDRALSLPVSSTANPVLPAPEGASVLGWNGAGTALENIPLTGLATAVAYGAMRYQTFAGNGTTVSFTLPHDPVTVGNLDVSIAGVVQVPGTDYNLVGTAVVFTSAPPLGATILVRYGQALGSTPSDSNDISFIQAGTGAVTRTAQAKMRDMVSVLDFGADPTGAVNSATAFTNAIATGKLVLVPKGTYLRGATSTTYATDHFLGIVRVGEKTTTNSSDPQVIVAREVDSSIGGNGHCFSDSSNINRPGFISYNSYDARVTWSGSNNYGHYAAFQSGAVYGCSGTTTDWFHFFAGLEVNNGTITNNRGLTFQAPVLSGSGYVRQNYAVYVDNVPEYTGAPSTATTNYALYSDGAARVWANGTATFKNIRASDTEGTPGARVHVDEPSGTAPRIRIQQQGQNYFDFVIPANQTYMQIQQAGGGAGTAVMTYRAGTSGVAGFGTYLPKTSDLGGASVHYHYNTVSAGTGADFYLSSNAYYNGGWKYSATTTAGQIALIGNTLRFNVATSGSADTAVNGTGTWTEAGRWQGNGYLLIGYTTSNGAYSLQVNSQIFATNATIATSDGRYKENVSEVTGALADVCALRPVAFDWKGHPVHNFQAGRSVGFIAQEVQQALAGRDFVGAVVKGNECELPDGTKEEFLGLSDGALIPLLVAAVKELKAQNDSLSARLAALESQ